MAAVTTQSLAAATLTAPSPITPAASDTIAAGQFGAVGIVCRVITTGTATNVTISDPGTTDLGNTGTPATLAASATGVGTFFIPPVAINPVTLVATINFSGARTGVTYELYRV
jgi:hypothetical protein